MSTQGYRSTLRADQAALGKARIVRAALDAFSELGYSGTTVTAIAERAGVSAQTVYNGFGNKRALLAAAYTLAIRGDDEQPLRDSPAYLAMLDAPTAAEMLARYAAIGAATVSRTAPIVAVILGESGIPDVGKLARIIERQRFAGAEYLVGRLTDRFELRPGLNTEDATDTLWSIMSWEIGFKLTGQRKWSWDRYEQWLAEMLIRALLPVQDRPATPSRDS
ncbi:helix-turn-helix transcriptional regulator [Agromyces intestinalis]|uniref:Helix-turn-helix transcriptional regulator n=1 Tax=Agromyces intestinalis TaxID=2592652 RepID=A0A5C1YFT3_9MICO|nr:helix-turn-helix domain-containing protein [Agromyces intestinalis]QEO14923.1 helix-turn-helix transcriptional regulator [Agromyces intestinalis]